MFLVFDLKYVEKGFTYLAKGAWVVFDGLNRIKPNPAFTPRWSDRPLDGTFESYVHAAKFFPSVWLKPLQEPGLKSQ